MEDIKKDLSELEALFARAARVPMPASPYLATRVLARSRELANAKRKLRLWQALSFGLVTAGLLVLFVLPKFSSDQKLEAQVNKPQVVMVKMQEAGPAAIASAEIALPEGVFFFSETIPGLKEKRELKVAWSRAAEKPYFPFVVRAEEAGTKVVTVRFRDSAGYIVTERAISIRFTKVSS